MKKLILTVGLPRSGKSTWAKGTGHPIVNRDAIRFSIGGSIRYFDDEDKVTLIEHAMVVALFQAGHDVVIVDACHLKQKYIDNWMVDKIEFISHARRFMEFDIELKRFYTPLDICMKRAAEDYPEDENFPAIIRNMWSKADTIDIPENQTQGYQKAVRGELNV